MPGVVTLSNVVWSTFFTRRATTGFISSPADDLGESLSIFFHTGNKKKSLKTFFSFEALETSEENLIKINQIAKVKGKIVPAEDKLQI